MWRTLGTVRRGELVSVGGGGLLQGYLAHTKQSPPSRPPHDPRHFPTVGF